MVINRTTKQRKPPVGQFVATDGRIVAGDILSLDVAVRVGMGWYDLREVEGEVDGYEWKDKKGVCVQTIAPVVIDEEEFGYEA